MSQENWTPTKQSLSFVLPINLVNGLAMGRNLPSQQLDCRIISNEVDRRINTVIAPLSTELEMLIQSVSNLMREIQFSQLKGN